MTRHGGIGKTAFLPQSPVEDSLEEKELIATAEDFQGLGRQENRVIFCGATGSLRQLCRNCGSNRSDGKERLCPAFPESVAVPNASCRKRGVLVDDEFIEEALTMNGPKQCQRRISAGICHRRPQTLEITENEDGTVTISRYIGDRNRYRDSRKLTGKTVSAIGNVTGTTGAFEGCTSITAVVIPDGVTEIQDNAFYDCTSLETVTIPSSVTLLRNCAFYDCPNLRAIYFKGDAPQQANYVFDSTENVTMYYQDGTSGWQNPWHGRPAEVYIPE